VLVNNVGAVTVHTGGFAGVTDEEWQAAWELNVMGTVRPTRAALPETLRRGGGSIVIVGSVNAPTTGSTAASSPRNEADRTWSPARIVDIS